MDFWRIWRLVVRRIYLIVGLALVATLLVLGGVFYQNQRAGATANGWLTLQQAPSPTAGNSQETVVQDTTKRISELVTQLRNNNDIYLEAANLLRLDESKRQKEVMSILERNNYFAPLDTQISEKIDQLIRDGELMPSERDAQLAKNRDAVRQSQVALLAAPQDRQGGFAPEGVKREVGDIIDRLREDIDVIPVASLLNTENAPQFDNQVQLQGRFPREAEATLYINMLSVAFVNYYAIGSQASGKVRIASLGRQKEIAERQRADAVNRLSAFKRKGEFEALIGQDATGQQLVSLEAELAKLRGERDAALQTMRSLAKDFAVTQKTSTVFLPASENPDYKSAKADVERIKLVVSSLATTKGENDPELQRARAELQTAQAHAKAAYKPFSASQPNPNFLTLDNAQASAKARFVGAEAALRPFEERYRKLRERLSRSPQLQAEYAKLVHDLDTVEKSLAQIDQALQKEQLDSIQSGRAGTILITKAHVLPSKNGWASGIKLLVYAFVLASLLGIGVVIAQDALDNSVQTKKDAEQLFGLPVAGEIPAQLPDPRRSSRVTYLDPLSPTAESYRLLRSEVQFSAMEKPFRSLVVAACKPGQGASTTVSNLAISLAQAGKKVILVDADLRHPSVHMLFDVANERGLTTLLSGGGIPIEDVLQRTEIDNLLVLTSGPLPLNPSELIGSPQMKILHDRLRSVADAVLFDAPSAIAFSDATLLASFVDATLLVIRAGDVPRGVVEQVKERLVRARANLIGVVFNGAEADQIDSVHYHNQYYPRLKAASRPSVAEPAVEAPRKGRVIEESDEDSFDYLVEEDDAPVETLPPQAPRSAPVAVPSEPVAVASPPKEAPRPRPAPTPTPAPAPVSVTEHTIRTEDDEISFDFEDDEDLGIEDDSLDFDEDDDDFDDDYDELPRRPRPSPRRRGGILSWFRSR